MIKEQDEREHQMANFIFMVMIIQLLVLGLLVAPVWAFMTGGILGQAFTLASPILCTLGVSILLNLHGWSLKGITDNIKSRKRGWLIYTILCVALGLLVVAVVDPAAVFPID